MALKLDIFKEVNYYLDLIDRVVVVLGEKKDG